jgi:hypothetical protein
LSFFVKKISQGEKLTSDIDMNEFIVHVYPIQNEEFLEDLPFNKLFVASAKQNRLANIKVFQNRILTYQTSPCNSFNLQHLPLPP